MTLPSDPDKSVEHPEAAEQPPKVALIPVNVYVPPVDVVPVTPPALSLRVHVVPEVHPAVKLPVLGPCSTIRAAETLGAKATKVAASIVPKSKPCIIRLIASPHSQ